MTQVQGGAEGGARHARGGLERVVQEASAVAAGVG
jgi:hypothetical protein